MSNKRQETVADIVAEMRKDIAEGTVGIWSDFIVNAPEANEVDESTPEEEPQQKPEKCASPSMEERKYADAKIFFDGLPAIAQMEMI